MIRFKIVGDRIAEEERKYDLFYYDMRNGSGTTYYIERYSFIDHIGTLITDTDILEDKEMITDSEFSSMNIEECPNLLEVEFCEKCGEIIPDEDWEKIDFRFGGMFCFKCFSKESYKDMI